MNYLHPTPQVLGYVEAPTVQEGNYTAILRAIPDGQAVILEYEDDLAIRISWLN